MADQPRPIAVVFKEILEGDLRKLAAESNDSPSGGGARDLRIPYEPFLPILRLFFPDVIDTSKNGGEVRRGRLDWPHDDIVESYDVDLWPPTDARPSEGRIARIHDLPPLHQCPEASETDPVFIVLTLDDTGSFRADFAQVSDLHSQWHHDVAGPILRSLDAAPAGKAACGYINFRSDTEYLHA